MDFLSHCESIKSKNFRAPLAYGIAREYVGQSSGEVISLVFGSVNYQQNENFYAILHDELGLSAHSSSDEFVISLDMSALERVAGAFRRFGFMSDESSLQGHPNLQSIYYALANPSHKYSLVVMHQDTKPTSIHGAYLRLHLLSTCLPPHSLCLDGVFGLLPNLAWAQGVPYELDYLRQNAARLHFSGTYPKVDYVDKFPRYLAHIVPDDSVRILDDAKVRFGAHISPRTTIMPGASYVNFNAGTLGAVMCEGRISSAARVGDGSDIGGGASILGVLSGTSGTPISVGKRCLLGANSVTGISLGDDCVVDAGIAVLEGSKLRVSAADLHAIRAANPSATLPADALATSAPAPADGANASSASSSACSSASVSSGGVGASGSACGGDSIVLKASCVSGLNAMHFRLDSLSGALTLKYNTKAVKLNKDLH